MKKILLGILAFGPIAFMILSIVFGFFSSFGTFGLPMYHTDQAVPMLFGIMILNFVLMGLGMLTWLVGWFVYIIHAATNRELAQEWRAVWIAAMVIFPFVPNIIYFVVHVMMQVKIPSIQEMQASSSNPSNYNGPRPPQAPPPGSTIV